MDRLGSMGTGTKDNEPIEPSVSFRITRCRR